MLRVVEGAVFFPVESVITFVVVSGKVSGLEDLNTVGDAILRLAGFVGTISFLASTGPEIRK